MVRSKTHAAAVMVKLLSQTETRVKVARKRKSLRCLTGYGAQLQRTSHDRGRSGVIRLPSLPAESERAADLDDTYDPLEWWKSNASALPCWSQAAQKIVLVQPSSAAAERVFSLLKSSFGDQQDNSLKDYVKSSLMLQYNKR